jgi:hypothetical protein
MQNYYYFCNSYIKPNTPMLLWEDNAEKRRNYKKNLTPEYELLQGLRGIPMQR